MIANVGDDLVTDTGVLQQSQSGVVVEQKVCRVWHNGGELRLSWV